MKRLLTTLASFLVSYAAHATADFPTDIPGVYKVRFNNGLADGSKFKSENILEIVPLTADTAYVRMELQFFNGHQGGIYGVATLAPSPDRTLTYDGSTSANGKCIISFQIKKDKIVTEADYSKWPECSYYHGARGHLSGAEFPLANRRPIKYLERLKKSRQFKEATEAFAANKRTNTTP